MLTAATLSRQLGITEGYLRHVARRLKLRKFDGCRDWLFSPDQIEKIENHLQAAKTRGKPRISA